MMNSTFWIEPTPFDWIFIILPPILLLYFAYGIWSDNRARRKKEEEQEAAFSAAINEWIEVPSSENAEEVSNVIERMRNGL